MTTTKQMLERLRLEKAADQLLPGEIETSVDQQRKSLRQHYEDYMEGRLHLADEILKIDFELSSKEGLSKAQLNTKQTLEM